MIKKHVYYKRLTKPRESRYLCQQVSEGAFLPVRACYPIRSTEQRERLGIQILLNMILWLQEERQIYGFAEWLICCCIYQSVYALYTG